MDVVGPLIPPGPAQLRFLLVLTDYFTKWIEAEAFSNVTSTTVTSFIWKKHHLSTWSTIRYSNRQRTTIHFQNVRRILREMENQD